MRIPVCTRLSVVPLAAALLFGCSSDEPGDLDSPPTIRNFSANPAEVASGATTELAWSVTDAESVRVLDGAGAELTSSAEPTGTVTSAALTENTTFTLEATNAAGTTTETVDVTVMAGAPVIVSLTASPDPVDYLADTTVSWEVTGAANVKIDVNNVEQVNGPELTGSFTVTADDLGLFVVRLVATGPGGEETTQTLPIDVVAPPGIEDEPNDTPADATELDEQGRATASLSASNDVDFFVIEVPEGGFVRAETSDGQGGCAVDQDMYLTDDTGAILATGVFGEFVLDNQGQAIGACRRIDPRVLGGARNLPAGTYYIQVESGMFDPPTGDYVLDVEVGAPGCGNGVIETGETCDDGNTSGGDSCPATCDAAPIGTVSNGDGTRNLFETPLGPLASAFVRIELGAESEMSVQTGTGDIGACSEQILATLIDSAGDVVLQSAGFQLSQQQFVPCGLMDPAFTPDIFPLPAGTYDLRIEAFDPEADLEEVDLLVRMFEGTGCGNGFQDPMELCDDGNAVDDDRCANDCTLNPLPIGSAAEVDVGTTFDAFRRVRIDVPATSIVSAQVGPAASSTTTDCGMDTLMAIIAPTAPGQQLSVTGVSASGRCAGIDPGVDGYAVGLDAGQHDFVILNGGLGAGRTVSVATGTVTPGCGNGVPEPASNETCDDGNTDDTDFCRNDCTVNPAFSEAEPNDNINQANVLPVMSGTTVTRVAELASDNDSDFYAVQLPQNADFAVYTYTTVGDRNACSGVDTILTVRDAQGSAVFELDDRPDQTLCSAIDSNDFAELQGLAAGTYYIQVRPYPMSGGGAYYLDVELR